MDGELFSLLHTDKRHNYWDWNVLMRLFLPMISGVRIVSLLARRTFLGLWFFIDWKSSHPPRIPVHSLLRIFFRYMCEACEEVAISLILKSSATVQYIIDNVETLTYSTPGRSLNILVASTSRVVKSFHRDKKSCGQTQNLDGKKVSDVWFQPLLFREKVLSMRAGCSRYPYTSTHLDNCSSWGGDAT